MKVSLHIEKLSIELSGDIEPQAAPIKKESAGTYSINGSTFPIPSKVMRLAKLWNQGLTGTQIGEKFDNLHRDEVVTLVSSLRKALPELFPYRGSIKQINRSRSR